MNPIKAGNFLGRSRQRRGLSQEDVAIRAGVPSVVVADIEADRVSPTVETLAQLLELLGEDLVLGVEERETGIDLTLNLGNLELRPEHRVDQGLAFADAVRENRSGGFEDLGRPAYPTYDLDVAYSGRTENLNRMAAALGEIGSAIDSHLLGERNVFSFDTEYGTLDILRRIAGVETYEQLRRDSMNEVLAGVSVQVASLNHLIAMKRAANRVKDRLMALEYVELANLHRRKAGRNAS